MFFNLKVLHELFSISTFPAEDRENNGEDIWVMSPPLYFFLVFTFLKIQKRQNILCFGAFLATYIEHFFWLFIRLTGNNT